MAEEANSDWETASEEDDDASASSDASPPEEWDVRRSLFDNHMSDSLASSLEYMWKNFGFYLPDTQFLTDPEGLVRYLVRSEGCDAAHLELLSSSRPTTSVQH